MVRRNLLFDVDNTIKRDVLNPKEVAKKLREQQTKSVVKKIKGSISPETYRERVNALVNEFLKKHPGLDKGQNWPENFVIVDTWEKFDMFLSSLEQSKKFAHDTETMGLEIWHYDYIVGWSYYTPVDKRAWYIPLKHVSCVEDVTGKQLHYCTVRQKIKPVLERKKQRIIENRRLIDKIEDYDPDIDFSEGAVTFNGKFDSHVIYNNFDIDMPDVAFEGYLAMRLLDENFLKPKLKIVCNTFIEKYQDHPLDTFDEIFEKIPCAYFPIWMVGYYACFDALITWEWKEFSEHHINIREGLRKSYWTVQLPCYMPTIEMEREGIRIDTEYAKALDEEFTTLLNGIERTVKIELKNLINSFLDNNPSQRIFIIRGKNDKTKTYDRDYVRNKLVDELNINSTTQLGDLFFDVLQWPTGKNDGKSTNEKVMTRLAKKHSVCQTILEYRSVTKLLSTYIRGIPEFISPIDNKVHGSFNPYGARTNRYASSDPNLQNIPAKPKTFIIDGQKVKIDFGKKIRPMFMADPDEILCSTDYSQIEPRITAVLSGCHVMLEAYRTRGRDIYSEMAKVFFPGHEDWEYYDNDVSHYKSPWRAKVKAIVLGLGYGMTKYGLAESLDCSVDEAEDEIERFFDTFPEIGSLMRGLVSMAKAQGFVECLYGTKRRLPNINNPKFEDSASRQAMNSPMQGGSAEITKRAMYFLWLNPVFRKLGGRLKLTVHDEVISGIPKNAIQEAIPIQREDMIKAAGLLVEMGQIIIKVDAEVFEKWYGEPYEWDDPTLDHKEDNDDSDILVEGDNSLEESEDDHVEESVEDSVFA